MGLNPFLCSGTFCTYVIQMTIWILFDDTFGEMAKGNKFNVEDKKLKLDTKKFLIEQTKGMRNGYECRLANLSLSLLSWLHFC